MGLKTHRMGGAIQGRVLQVEAGRGRLAGGVWQGVGYGGKAALWKAELGMGGLLLTT